MTDQVNVGVELDKLKAEKSLRDFARQLDATDQLINQLKRSGVIWAEDFSSATGNIRKEVSKLGTITSQTTNAMIQGNKAFGKSIDSIATKVQNLQKNLLSSSKNFLTPLNASKLPITATLRNDNEKRRSAYFTQLQQQYQKEQASLNTFYTAIKKAEQARKGKTKADKEAISTSAQLANSSTRLGIATLSQTGQVNKLSTAWKLAKQNMRESISVANLFQTTARGLTATVGNLVVTFVQFLKQTPSLASDMLGFRNALQLVTGSQAEASNLLNTAIDIAIKLKLSIVAVTKEYSKFTNSATIAGLSVEKATHTFESFAIAARVLNLNQQRTSGMFLALEQMISKGRVSMEELRRQLGEHIPGALNLAAQAMGYGTNELGKFIKEVSNGNVVSIELVQNLGELLRGRTAKLLPNALKKFSASLQNFENAFTQLGIKVGDVAANVLGPILDFLARGLRAFAEWIPVTSLLGEKATSLSGSLEEVSGAAGTVTSTFNTLNNSGEMVAGMAENASANLANMQENMSAVNIAGLAMIGTVGASGLGGAFAVLGKAAEWVKKGLKNFAAPFLLLGNKLKPLIALLGAAGLYGILLKIGQAVMIVVRSVKALIFIATVTALAHPWIAAAAAITAAATALALYTDSNERGTEINKSFNNTFNKIKETSAAVNTRLEEIVATMTDLGQVDIAVNAANIKTENDKLSRRTSILKEHQTYLNDQFDIWDKIGGSIGYVTDNTRRLNNELHEVTVALEQTSQEMDKMPEKMHLVDAQARLVLDAFEKLKIASQEIVSNARMSELQLELELVGADSVEAEIKRINQKTKISANKLIAEDGYSPETQTAIDRLVAEKDLEIQLVKRKASYSAAEKVLKAFETAQKSMNKTLAASITGLEQQSVSIGKTGLELDQLNSKFKIATLEEKLLELETKATTKAQLQQVAVMRQQIGTITALHQNLNLLKDQERLRKVRLEQQNEATQKKRALMTEGHKLLSKTISLEQQFALRLNEVVPALKAVGASNEQIKVVMQQEWRQIVDNADNGLKSMEALSEEFAKGMQENFSDFFFDIMEGNFDNLADSFTSMLNRMVAEAIATNLTKHIMGPGGGGGILDSIFGSNIGSALFNTAPSMPSIGSLSGGGLGGVGTMSMGSGFINLPGAAYGADFKVGGTGGTDSQIVAFKATPGERVIAVPPTKQNLPGTNSTGGGDNVVVHFSVTTPDIDSFNASQPQLGVELTQLLQNAKRNT